MYEWPTIAWDDLHRHRASTVRSVMQSTGVDALLITGFDNIRYATGFRTWFIAEAFDWYAAIITAGGESYIFVPYVDEDVKDPVPGSPWIREFIATPSWVSSATQAKFWLRVLQKKLEALRLGRVGIEGLPPVLLDGLRQAMPKVEFRPVEKPLASARMVKHPEEIKLLAASAEVASLGSSATLATLSEGKTDHELLATAAGRMLELGAEYVTHYLCLHKGSQDWYSHGTRLCEGDTYVFDVGCYALGGYGADMCRTGFVGTPPRAVQDGYRILRQAYGEGQAAARAGMKVSQVDRIINDALRKVGHPHVPYSMGHGVGMRTCELPIIHRPEFMDEDVTLETGMVITLEPETRVDVNGRQVVLKLEDMFEVTPTGLRQLTTTGYGG